MNEEYLSYVDYLKSIDFEKILVRLKEKYQTKKVILFGLGVFLDAILDNYNISDYLNVIGISDTRFDEQQSTYKGFNLYKPLALRALNVNVVLDTNILFERTTTFLRKNDYVKKSVVIDKIIQFTVKERLLNFYNHIKSLYNYTILYKNPIKTIYYAFTCTTEEILSKNNYKSKLDLIRQNDLPIRTVFVCSEVEKINFIGLYNLLKSDKNFKVLPIILTPKILLDSEGIDEELMAQNLKKLEESEVSVIDGIDRDTNELPSIHAFKPDLVFYQNPIYIKDDYTPFKMSEKALTFTIEYDVRNADFTSIGSKYFRKQVGNMWKVFVNNEDDKKLYSEYTDLNEKDVVEVVNKNINSGIYKYLRKTLNR